MGAFNVCGRDQKQINQQTMKQIKSLQKKYQKEHDEKNNYKQKIQLLKSQLQTLRENNAKRERQIQQPTSIEPDKGEKTIRKQQNFVASPSNSNENEIREQKQIFNKKEQEYEQKIKQLQKLLKQKDSQVINKNNSRLKDLQEQIQQYEKLVRQKDNQTQQLEAHLHQIEQKDKQLEQRQQNLQNMISVLREQLQIAKQREEKEEAHYQSILTQLKNTIQSLESQKHQIGIEIDKTRNQLLQKEQMLEQNTKHSEEQKKQIKKSLDELNNKCRKYEEQVKEKDRQMKQLNTKILNTSITQQNQRSSRKQASVNDLKQKLEEYISERDRIRLSRDRMSRTVAQMKHHSLFNVDLLQDEPDHKQFLVSAIQARMNKQIAKTKLVYKYDELNKLNLHKYIDNKYFLVLIVKLQNGYYLATFTEGPFYPKMQSKYDGMILSLTNRKAFVPLVKNKRAISYDDFFIIFGNSEVRLKTQQKKLFSNFAINNGYYNSNGEKVNILLGTSIREIPLESYEFYELTFK